METQPLFAVEFILDHPTPTKEHIVVLAGEMGMVLLMKHDKLSDGKYIVEKSDGTGEMLHVVTMETNEIVLFI